MIDINYNGMGILSYKNENDYIIYLGKQLVRAEADTEVLNGRGN